jgi:hypothetical protein
MNVRVFFFPLVQNEQRKASKAPKNRFSKSGKRTHFSGVRPACTSVVLLSEEYPKGIPEVWVD